MKYFLRSAVLFLMLYSLVLFASGNLYFDGGISLVRATHLAIGILLLQYILAPVLIGAILDIDWNAGLPLRNQQFLESLCRREELPVPRVGVIQGAVPNAFTFGHTRKSANIVVTSGLIDLLTQDELDAVVAHEAGHIKHRDFLVIAAAAMAPMVMFQLYLWLRRLKEDHWGTWMAFLVYWFSEMVVKMLSRSREYWADAFSAEVTRNPTALSSALVKISYAISKEQRETAWANRYGSVTQKIERMGGVFLSARLGALGIAAPDAALLLAGTAPGTAARVIKWDMVNPWARIHECLSTHPLTAFRISALNHLSWKYGRATLYPVPEWTKIEWRRFPLELVLWGTPWLIAFLMAFAAALAQRELLFVPESGFAVMAIALFFAWAARTLLRYRGAFEDATVEAVLEDTMPNTMRPRAVRIEGQIAARGVQGAFRSPDLVLTDETGSVFLPDRNSSLMSRMMLVPDASRLAGQRVIVEGWYRREPVPALEISSIRGVEEPIACRSQARWMQLVHAAAASAALFWLLGTSH